MQRLSALLLCLVLIGSVYAVNRDCHPSVREGTVQRLDDLSIDSLRRRSYGSTLLIEKKRSDAAFESYIASYESDGLRVYARIDRPPLPAPETGYPVVVFVHGWRGIDKAPTLNFYYEPNSYYYDTIEAYRNAGFVVIVPGLRGHGTVNGVPADGIEYMAMWDDGSYLMPVFYAIDVLNLLDGLTALDDLDLNLEQVNLSGHSQGGDTVLLALAIAGEGSEFAQPIHAASIWSGTIAPRLTQLESFAPMQQTPEAFLAGDGTWTGTATGLDGSVNPHFVFGYPADWIEHPDPTRWTWQEQTWSAKTVNEVLLQKLEDLYLAMNSGVHELEDARFRFTLNPGRRAIVEHDPRVAQALMAADPSSRASWLTEPIALHFSDRDFYSHPAWNRALCEQQRRAGYDCYAFEYAQNTHSLGVSEYDWFSNDEARPGLPLAIQRDKALFLGLTLDEEP